MLHNFHFYLPLPVMPGFNIVSCAELAFLRLHVLFWTCQNILRPRRPFDSEKWLCTGISWGNDPRLTRPRVGAVSVLPVSSVWCELLLDKTRRNRLCAQELQPNPTIAYILRLQPHSTGASKLARRQNLGGARRPQLRQTLVWLKV